MIEDSSVDEDALSHFVGQVSLYKPHVVHPLKISAAPEGSK